MIRLVGVFLMVMVITTGCAQPDNYSLQGEKNSTDDVTIEYRKSNEEQSRNRSVKGLGKAVLISTPTILTIATGGAAFPLMLIQYWFFSD
jgi:hypothetical protein